MKKQSVTTESTSIWVRILGFVASVVSTVSFVPQVYEVWSKMPSPATSVSLSMYIVLVIGCVLWLIYGLKIHARPIWLTNVFILTFGLSIIFYKLTYG